MPRKNSCLSFYFFLRRSIAEQYDILKILPQLESTDKANNTVKARIFIEQVNRQLRKRGASATLSAAEVLGISLIQEIYLKILEDFIANEAAIIWQKTDTNLDLQTTEINAKQYAHFFTPQEVIKGIVTNEQYAASIARNPKERQRFYFELLLILLSNENPAFTAYRDFFSDIELRKHSHYSNSLQLIINAFRNGPPLGKKKNNLYLFLKEPVEAAPYSIPGQLEYIFKHWAELLPDHLLLRLLQTLDTVREEEMQRGMAGGVMETILPDYSNSDLFPEYEAFSPDRDWMPNLVMIAKSTYVWLYQLSRQYNREIKTLDQIPDEELDRLARWGFSGLWLIGLWERSPASARIKHLCGNPEALSSAYSLYDYTIAKNLGGEVALQDLKMRCANRGIRLAADMVPNHTGIYSKWIIEHPEWFLSLDYSPFPSYSFTGENLSQHPDIGIYIEDGYWNKSDAAVVFKRVDFRTGQTKYIYHGNDGTTMPWNDTAQIDYLNPEAREAVIETILNVARQFSIIRFDAAMTLAKRHIQRLWYPEPGSGGAIPSRSDFSRTREEFNQAMPNEFWREVVDRAAIEVPDTLLLAEAFWMMEGYFVRTLGMHRVYNSAFMNMLKKEENQKYRNLIRETLEFNPEILKRYVNFMSNPDEETAVAQFAKGDKYFGVALMMVTLPGLPMWGHGQIEGYTEKYGMEYGRSYFDEFPDPWLVSRHEKEIFPLMHKRHLFSGVERFTLYDFVTPQGHVDENVFAYSNMAFGERSLVIYNNRYANTNGFIKNSTGINPAGAGTIIHRNLIGALELHPDENWYTIFRDHLTELEYIRNNAELRDRGLFVMLGAYGSHVFLDFREQQDEHGLLAEVCQQLNGAGTKSIEESIHELRLKPIQEALRILTSTILVRKILNEILNTDKIHSTKEWITFLAQEIPPEQAVKIASQLRAFGGTETQDIDIHALLAATLSNFQVLIRDIKTSTQAPLAQLREQVPAGANETYEIWRIPLIYQLCQVIVKAGGDGSMSRNIFLFSDWRLNKMAQKLLINLGARESQAVWEANLIEILFLLAAAPAMLLENNLEALVNHLLAEPKIKQFLQVHTYEHVLWFHKESFELLLYWLLFLTGIYLYTEKKNTAGMKTAAELLNTLAKAAEKSGYRLSNFAAEFDTQGVAPAQLPAGKTPKPAAAKPKRQIRKEERKSTTGKKSNARKKNTDAQG